MVRHLQNRLRVTTIYTDLNLYKANKQRELANFRRSASSKQAISYTALQQTSAISY